MLVAFTTNSCIEEIETSSFTFEKLLVVDANISDQTKPHEVRLTYTAPVDGDVDDISNAVSGATVWVEDDLGSRVDFVEQSAGIYSSPTTFAGKPGRSYALFITTSEGKRYQSLFEKLVQAPEISAIYNRFAIESTGQTAESIPGVQFFIDVEDDSQSTQFYRYEWTDAHQIIVPFLKKWEAIPTYGFSVTFKIVPFNEDVKECYRESQFNELILATSANNINDGLSEIPVNFIAASEFDVTTMYSIEVTQRAISAQAFSYYRKMELFNESNGSLFDKQQGVIVGNISSIDSPDEQVLGYFEVAGASSKRVFVEPFDLDEKVMDYIVRPCEKYPVLEYEKSLELFYDPKYLSDAEQATIVPIRELYELYDIDEGTPVKFLAHHLCADCRRRGSIGKPDWWP